MLALLSSFANKKTTILVVVLLLWLAIPAASWAETDIKISVSDPDKKDQADYIGTTVNKVLDTPTVSFGENRVLGTLRITGKEGIDTPIKPGNKVKVSLPVGLSYMQVPNAQNYKNYVQWPEKVDGLKNQIVDGSDIPGVKFIAGTPRSITVEIGNVDYTGKTLALDFVFNKENFSTVRVTKLIEVAEDYKRHPNEGVTRLEFAKMLADVTVPFSSSASLTEEEQHLVEKFTDLPALTTRDKKNLSRLVKSGIIAGYPGGLFKPDKNITRAEAAVMVGRILPESKKKAVFKDNIPAWALESINNAKVYGLVVGYPDGTFRPDQLITKSEAVEILQRVLESYAN
ncbi:S-layer homology domain-containing protein [Desulfotomaculum nigrificans]|uniref:S-layer homology domain-containing protein n=1 Tax=Desulfotomaculum nigrificans TaxID=1565 RepID=UPI0002EAC566